MPGNKIIGYCNVCNRDSDLLLEVLKQNILYFLILFLHSVHRLHSICWQIWKTQQGPQDWKRSAFIPIPKKGNAKECLNHYKTVLISHASKTMLKILPARLQQYVNHELPDVQADFRKGRGTRDTYICTAESLFCMPDTITTLVINYALL